MTPICVVPQLAITDSLRVPQDETLALPRELPPKVGGNPRGAERSPRSQGVSLGSVEGSGLGLAPLLLLLLLPEPLRSISCVLCAAVQMLPAVPPLSSFRRPRQRDLGPLWLPGLCPGSQRKLRRLGCAGRDLHHLGARPDSLRPPACVVPPTPSGSSSARWSLPPSTSCGAV